MAARVFAPIGLTLLALWIYSPLLGARGAVRFPWGADTLGHVLKAEYLAAGLAEGSLYPDLLPCWYMGVQMLRYYPPLPYYLLVGLSRLAGDPVAAAHWLVAIGALVGSLTWLLYRRWVGVLPALAGGALYLFLPDNLRVALAEGNLPRVVASALLPFVIYCLLRLLEAGRRRHQAGLALCFAALTLSHAMMAAIYAAGCITLAFLMLVARATPRRWAALAMGLVTIGLLLSGWWLLPSLRGGITGINAAAMTEALAVFPLTHYLNPSARFGNPEAIYIGLALLVLPIVLLFVRAGRSRTTGALTLTGAAGVLITTPQINQLWNSLPFHQLFWPLRFLGLASTLLLLAIIWRLRSLNPVLAVATVALLAIDGAGSLPLVHTRPLSPDIAAAAGRLHDTGGWRLATLDLSRLGSSASYAFSATGGREQIFGWAYQGAHTARTVAALNEALEHGATGYLVDRLNLYGVDDVVLLDALPRAAEVGRGLQSGGFRIAARGAATTHYSRHGAPRAYLADWPALGIGRGAQNAAYLFPAITIGTSPQLDDYTIDELRRYKTVVLAGFSWRDRAAAEALVRMAAESGVQVVVDMASLPEDPQARIPRFLGVWAEPVILHGEAVQVVGSDRRFALQPLGSAAEPWVANTPQGLDTVMLTFEHMGEHAAVVGSRALGASRVWFVGLNLAYHGALTNDPAAVALLAEMFGLPPGSRPERRAVQLDEYRADQHGYRFGYTLAAPGRLFVPVSALEGINVTIDGAPVAVVSYERLLAFDAPAGTHSVSITVSPTGIYTAGLAASGLAVIALTALLLWPRPARSQREGLRGRTPANLKGKPGLLSSSTPEPPAGSRHGAETHPIAVSRQVEPPSAAAAASESRCNLQSAISCNQAPPGPEPPETLAGRWL
jgi:uncharacterized membrane protein